VDAVAAPRAARRDERLEQRALLRVHEPGVIGTVEGREERRASAVPARGRGRARGGAADDAEPRVRAPPAGRRKTCVASHAFRVEQLGDGADPRRGRGAGLVLVFAREETGSEDGAEEGEDA
jgi:hypothetical protein